jgi:lysophospholipase L1-like esterase
MTPRYVADPSLAVPCLRAVILSAAKDPSGSTSTLLLRSVPWILRCAQNDGLVVTNFIMKHFISFLLAIVPLFSLAQAPTAPAPLSMNPPESPGVINPALPTIFIAGDSTAARAREPQQGWAVPFAGYFDLAKVNVVNLALGGRSSRTFITQGWWDKLLAQLKAGDFVLIQFGHNDASPINEEETVPPGSRRSRGVIRSLGDETVEIVNILTKQPETVHSYGWYMRKMIADVKAKGATPIVLSITLRNQWNDGKVERSGGPWRELSRELASTAGIAYVDLSGLIGERYDQLGQEAVKAFFPRDATHTGQAGAELNASLVVAGLKGLPQSPFMNLLSNKGAAVPATAPVP